MARDYTQQTWENAPSTNTPVSATRLLYVEGGIDDAVEDVQAHEDAAAPHSGHETPSGAQAKVDSHANTTTGVHGSTSSATASKIVERDAAGRAQFATPSAAADAATKGYVDGEITTLDAAKADVSHTHKTIKEVVFAIAGNLAVGDDAAPFDMDTRNGVATGQLIDVIVRVKGAPAGAAIKVNVAYKNDDGSGRTDLFAAGNRPQISAGAKRGVAATFAATSIPASKIYQVDIDQVGSSTAGADLIVILRYYEASQTEA